MFPLRLLLVASPAILIVACSSPGADVPPAPPAFNTAAVKAVLDSLIVHYHDRFRDSTPAYFAARYTNDACVMAPNMPRVCGINDITVFYWNNGQSRNTGLDIKGEEVTGTAEEVTEVGSYRVLDKETELDKGKFIAIYRNEDGMWKVHREIWNSDLTWTTPDSAATGQQ